MSSSATMQQAKTEAAQAARRQQSKASAVQSKLSDLRPQTTAQRQLQDTANNSPQSHQLNTFQQMAQNSARSMQLKAMSVMMNAPAVQRVEEDDEPLQAKSAGETVQREAADAAEAPKPNNTGLPDHLKSGIESLSGMSMDHVKVHYNSAQPAQLNAHAYAQGSDIHVAPGQERHLPHEAWHVVQQAQGRVKPTMQMKAGTPVNDDAGLEAEADVMGGLASVKVANTAQSGGNQPKSSSISLVQSFAHSPTSRTAQLTPAAWVASAPLTVISNLPHGWFSTWKKVKAKIEDYKALPTLNYAARTATLDRMTALIVEWRNDSKHQLNSQEQRVQNIITHLPTLNNLISVEREEIRDDQLNPDNVANKPGAHVINAMGGHSLDRHGPDLTDAQLGDRLRTQTDRTGAPAPATTSSRFASYGLYNQTYNAAVALAQTAQANTIADLAGVRGTFAANWNTFVGMAPSAAKRTYMTNTVNPNKNAVVNAAGLIVSPSVDRLGVRIIGPNMGGGNVGNIAARVRDMVRVANGNYAVTINHGVNVGPSFDGVGVPDGTGRFSRVQAGAMQQSTTTVFAPPNQQVLENAAPNAWPLVTHFPSSDPAGITW